MVHLGYAVKSEKPRRSGRATSPSIVSDQESASSCGTPRWQRTKSSGVGVKRSCIRCGASGSRLKEPARYLALMWPFSANMVASIKDLQSKEPAHYAAPLLTSQDKLGIPQARRRSLTATVECIHRPEPPRC